MSGYGVPHDDIARIQGIAPKTLRKHFRVELDRGSAKATAKIAQTLFNIATNNARGKEQVTALIFWLKARAGWREVPAADPNARPGEEGITIEGGLPTWATVEKAAAKKGLIKSPTPGPPSP